jgi:hypothetical protein
MIVMTAAILFHQPYLARPAAAAASLIAGMIPRGARQAAHRFENRPRLSGCDNVG